MFALSPGRRVPERCAERVVRAVTSVEIRPVAVNNQPIRGESGRSVGRVEQNHFAEQNQPSDAPDAWQSTGRCPIETAREETGREVSSDEEHDREDCEEEREGQRPGSPPSTQPSQPSAQPASQKTDGQTKQDYVQRGHYLSKTNDKKSKKPKAVKQTRMSLFTERRSRSHTPKRRREGDSPLVVTRWKNSSSSVLHVAHIRKRP